jgi:hypothetical protein
VRAPGDGARNGRIDAEDELVVAEVRPQRVRLRDSRWLDLDGSDYIAYCPRGGFPRRRELPHAHIGALVVNIGAARLEHEAEPVLVDDADQHLIVDRWLQVAQALHDRLPLELAVAHVVVRDARVEHEREDRHAKERPQPAQPPEKRRPVELVLLPARTRVERHYRVTATSCNGTTHRSYRDSRRSSASSSWSLWKVTTPSSASSNGCTWSLDASDLQDACTTAQY